MHAGRCIKKEERRSVDGGWIIPIESSLEVLRILDPLSHGYLRHEIDRHVPSPFVCGGYLILFWREVFTLDFMA